MSTRHQLLGEILIREGKLNEPQLAEALGAQEIFGGRLGTNLIDLELLSILDLGWYLALQLGVPEARPEELLAASPRLLDQFPRELAGRLQVFPLRSVDRVLHLAMVSPTDLQQIDEVTFATGQKVKPYVAPELRMLFFLEQRYGFARDKRFVRVRAEGEPEDPRRTELEEARVAVPPHLGEHTISDARDARIEIASSSVRADSTGPFSTAAPAKPTRRKSAAVPRLAQPAAPPPLGPPAPRVSPTPPASTAAAPAVAAPQVVGRGRSAADPAVAAPQVVGRGRSAADPAVAAPLQSLATDEISEADLQLVFLDDVHATRASTEEEADFEVTVVEPEEPAAKPAFAVLAAATVPSGEGKPSGEGRPTDLDTLFDEPPPEPNAAPQVKRHPPRDPFAAKVPLPAPRDPIAAVAEELERARDRDAVASALVQVGFDGPTIAVLFVLRGEMAVAVAARGSELSRQEVACLILPFQSSRLLREAAERGEPVLGSTADDPIQQLISGFLRVAAPEQACVAPVLLARRAVNLLCVQAPHGSQLPAGVCAELAGLCAKASSSYARLIRELKGKA